MMMGWDAPPPPLMKYIKVDQFFSYAPQWPLTNNDDDDNNKKKTLRTKCARYVCVWKEMEIRDYQILSLWYLRGAPVNYRSGSNLHGPLDDDDYDTIAAVVNAAAASILSEGIELCVCVRIIYILFVLSYCCVWKAHVQLVSYFRSWMCTQITYTLTI